MKEDGLTQAAPSLTEVGIVKEAMYWTPLENEKVQCKLCFRECIINPGRRGYCRTRANREGKLYALSYGRACALDIDPIEKEPQLHFLPGSDILCLATAGCNLRCIFCQNWHISMAEIESVLHYNILPADIVEVAAEKKIPTISFTYTEPTSFYEYMYEIAEIAKSKDIGILIHSNGMINAEPLKELLKYTSAVTIDFKGFSDKFYKETGNAKLEPVLRTMKIIKRSGVWLELVNLVVPGYNDDPDTIKEMCIWITENLGPDVPLHFSRYHPANKLQNPATPIKTLEEAHSISTEVGLKFVTIGNVPGHKLNSTYCPECKKRIIYRVHFNVLENNIVKRKCKFCSTHIPGVWE